MPPRNNRKGNGKANGTTSRGTSSYVSPNLSPHVESDIENSDIELHEDLSEDTEDFFPGSYTDLELDEDLSEDTDDFPVDLYTDSDDDEQSVFSDFDSEGEFDDDLDDPLVDEHTHLIELDEDAQEYSEGVIGSRESEKSRLYHGLTAAVRGEARARAGSEPGHEDGNELHSKDIYIQADQVRDQIWSSIQSSAIALNEWKDSYCIDSCTETVNDLLAASPDRQYPLAVDAISGRIACHVAGNVLVTSRAFNFFCGPWPKIIFPLTEKSRTASTIEALEEVDEAFRNMFDSINEMHGTKRFRYRCSPEIEANRLTEIQEAMRTAGCLKTRHFSRDFSIPRM